MAGCTAGCSLGSSRGGIVAPSPFRSNHVIINTTHLHEPYHGIDYGKHDNGQAGDRSGWQLSWEQIQLMATPETETLSSHTKKDISKEKGRR